MKRLIESWNLRPGEIRLVVASAMALFLVLNALFIWPHFKDWKVMRTELAQARADLVAQRAEVKNLPKYTTERERLEGAGNTVSSVDQVNSFTRTAQDMAMANKVSASRWNPTKESDALFEKVRLTTQITATETDLIDFLYRLGASRNSNIRVRDMDLKPDAAQQRLMGNLTLTASYLKAKP